MDNPVKNKKPLLFILSGILFFLTSCLTVDADMIILPDGNGTLNLEYSLDTMFAGVQMDSSATDRLILFPVSQTEFIRAADTVPGIILSSLSEESHLDSRRIIASLSYESVRSLNELFHYSLVMEENGDIRHLKMILFDQDTPLDRETVGVLEALAGDDVFSFRIQVPGLIRSSTRGAVSRDSRSVQFSGNLTDVYKEEPFIWDLEWQQ